MQGLDCFELGDNDPSSSDGPEHADSSDTRCTFSLRKAIGKLLLASSSGRSGMPHSSVPKKLKSSMAAIQSCSESKSPVADLDIACSDCCGLQSPNPAVSVFLATGVISRTRRSRANKDFKCFCSAFMRSRPGGSE